MTGELWRVKPNSGGVATVRQLPNGIYRLIPPYPEYISKCYKTKGWALKALAKYGKIHLSIQRLRKGDKGNE